MTPDDFPTSLFELGQSVAAEGTSAPAAREAQAAVRGPMLAAQGAAGLQIAMRDLKRIAVWQLVEPLARHVTDGVTDDIPSALASPVWHFPADGSGPVNRYLDAGASSRSMRVYHVGAFSGERREQLAALDADQPGTLGIPKLAAGDRVLAALNNQSGRWEIFAPAEDLWRFELKTSLAPGEDRDVPSTAEAYLVVYDASEDRYVTTGVTFKVADFLHRFDAPPGCRGYARRLADSSPHVGWEVLALATPPAGASGE